MAALKAWQRQLQEEMQDLKNMCEQRFQDLSEKFLFVSKSSQEQDARVKNLETKAQLSLYRQPAQRDVAAETGREAVLTSQQAPFPQVQAQAMEAGAEAAAAVVARRVAERVRQDLEAEMETLRRRFSQVVRDVEGLHQAAAQGRAAAADTSADSLRRLLVEALIRPCRPGEVQQMALKLLSQALDAATLLSAATLSPEPSAPIAEIFRKHESAAETRKICEEILAERVSSLLADCGPDTQGAVEAFLTGKTGNSASATPVPSSTSTWTTPAAPPQARPITPSSSKEASLPPPPQILSQPARPRGAPVRPVRLAALGPAASRRSDSAGPVWRPPLEYGPGACAP
ncbi:unnamed protein product [Symbiodinium pilosum]|uniref:Uncharacterized protein n=1 Tax=Symbiodinium pilosum TaxID=2952 RepID=A0A812JJX9_SYMPI|nr:unnamed protein product [Symbiodinium pilosum]